MAEGATAEGKAFAAMLREVLERLAALGLPQRGVSELLGSGFSNTELSRMASGARIPTPDKLAKLLLLVEAKAGQRLPAGVRAQLEAANVRALQSMGSEVHSLVTTQEQIRQLQLLVEEWRAREALASQDLARALAARKDLDAELRRARQRKSQVSRVVQEQLREQSAKHTVQQAAADRRLAGQRAEIADLQRSSERLERQIEQLRGHVQIYQAELAEAQRALQVERARAEEAEQAAFEERDRRERLGEEVAVLTDLLNQARAELAELRRVHAEGLAHADVLAEAEAVVRRAQRAAQRQPVAPGSDGSDIDSAPGTMLPPALQPPEELVHAGQSASAAEVASLLKELLDHGDTEAAGVLLRAVAERPAEDVVAVLDALTEAGCYRQREQLARACAFRPADTVVDLLRALHRHDAASEAGWLLDEAARTPTATVRDLVSLLLEHQERAYARRLLDEAVPRGSVEEVAALIGVVEQGWHGEAERLVEETVARRPVRDVVALMARLSPAAVQVALEALSRRPPSSLASALVQLSAVGQRSLGAQLAERAAGRPVGDVAALAVLLEAQARDAERDWLLDAYLQQRPGQALALVNALTEQGSKQGSSVAALMVKAGKQASVSQVEDLWTYALDHELPCSTVLRGVVCRHPEEIWTLLAVLAYRSPQLAQALLEQVMLDTPAQAAADVLERCLESGLGALDVAAVAGASVEDLECAVRIAEVLRERGWDEYFSFLRATGESLTHSPDAITTFLTEGLASWVLEPFLTGIAARDPWECCTVICGLAARGLDGHVRLTLEYGPEVAGIPDLVGCLIEEGMDDYIFALHSRMARTASAHELAEALETASPTAAGEIISLLTTRPAPYLADLVTWLVRYECGQHILALLSAVGRGPSHRAQELADLLCDAGRERQGAWLSARAGLMRQRTPTDLPPAESISEAADAARQLFADDRFDACLTVLHGVIAADQVGPLAIASHLDADLLEHFLGHHLDHDDDDARSLYPSDPETLCAYLDRLDAHSPLRERLIRLAVLHTPLTQYPELFSALRSRTDDEELTSAYRCVAHRSGDDVAAAAEVLRKDDSTRMRLMLLEALRTHTGESIRALTPILRADGAITSMEELRVLLATRSSDPDAVAAIRSAFTHLLQPPGSDRPFGYYLRDPRDTQVRYWDGKTWTGNCLPLLDKEGAQAGLGKLRQDFATATLPREKARVSQLLVAALTFLETSDHPDTLAARHVHAYWLSRIGRFDQARRISKQLIADFRRVGGAIGPLRHNHAEWTGEAGRPAEAVLLFKKLVDDLSRVKTTDPSEAFNARARLAVWMARSGDEQAAAFSEMTLALLRSFNNGLLPGWVLTRQAEIHREAGNYAESVVNYTSALTDSPRDSALLAGRGLTHLTAGHHNDALTDFTAALELNPDNLPALVGRAQAHLETDRYESAIADFTTALSIVPKDAKALAGRGEAHRLAGRYDDAITDFSAALAINAGNAWALARRGEAKRELGRLDEAIIDLTTALDLDPDDSWTLGSRGEAHRQTGNHSQAMQDLDAAVRLDNTCGWIFEARAQTHRQAGRYEDAIADFSTALRVYPNDPWTLTQLGITRRELGNYALAREDLNQAATHSDHPGNPGLLFETTLLDTLENGFSTTWNRWTELLHSPTGTACADATRFFPLFRTMLLEPAEPITPAALAFLADGPDHDALTDLLHYLNEFAKIPETAEHAQQCRTCIQAHAPR